MSKNDPLGSLEEARKRLYSANETPVIPKGDFSVREVQKSKHKWTYEKHATGVKKVPHKHVRIALMFFWSALVFFMLASGVAAYLFFSGSRSVSTNNVSITIKGPTTIAGGDTVSLLLSVVNNNPAPIEDANITLTFPAGTRSASNVLTSLTHDTENLGTITAGGRVERTVKVVLFGGQGDVISIPAALQFRTVGSNAIFVKKSSYTLSVVATPLSVSVDAPPETVPGQPYSLTATVRSNATAPLAGVVLRVYYPTGFTPTNTSIKPVGNSFVIGTLEPGAVSIVKITGTIAGQNGEQRVFRFAVGTTDGTSDSSIAVDYMKQTTTVNITKPFLATSLNINGSSADQAVIAANTRTSVSLAWTNTLDVPITNANITVSLSGASFDPSSVSVVRGQYQSSNKTIVFSRDSDASLGMLAPGAQGVGTFTFSAIPPVQTASSSPSGSPIITISVTVSGQRTGQSNVPEVVTSSVTKTIKVATAMSLDAYALHSTGPFTNTGPVPAVANQTTTYTVVWNASNTTSDIAGGVVSANLPSDVQFIKAVQSANSPIVYDSGEHTITWNIGDLGARSSTQTAFQVAVTPSTSQQGAAMQLVAPATLSAFDRFAQVSVSVTSNPVTTDLSRDPSYSGSSSSVQ